MTALGDEPLAPLVLARHVDARRVLCVGRPVVQWRVSDLLSVLRRDGRQVDWLALEAADVPAALGELEARLPRRPAGQTYFDLTNAHGLVGFAIYEIARRREQAQPDRCRLVRIDWSERVVRAISPDRADAEQLRVHVPIAEFLELHGKRLLGVQRAKGSRGAFGRAAYRIARDLPAARPLLEAAHHGAWNRPLRVRPAAGTGELIDELIDDGLLRGGHHPLPTDLRAFEFLHGRWLEEYLFEIADASGRFDDCASGLRFRWAENGDLANEIDFVGTAGGRATMASCKTGFRDAAAPLYELLTLAERAAGRSVVAVFATSEPLERPARRRAAALGVRVLDPEHLADPERVLAALLS